MENTLFKLAFIFYFVSTIISIADIFKGSRGLSKLILFITGTGFLFHSAQIIYRYIEVGQLPITGMHQAISFFAWCIVFIFFFLKYKYKIGILASFILPLVFILMLSSSVFPREIYPLTPKLQSHWLVMHVVLAFIGNAAFAVACGIGFMYLLQEYYIKSKHIGGLFQRLPNLQVLDEINYKLIIIGFPLFTLAIMTGALWAQSAWGRFWGWDPKETWSLITWLVYAFILHSRLIAGWQGKRAAVLSIVGFLSVLITFFGVNLLLTSIHTF